MNQTNSISVLLGEKDDALQALSQIICADYHSRERVLDTVTQCHHLMKDVQRHRGISMRLLAGNNEFEEEFSHLQKQIDKRLAVIAAFVEHDSSLFSTKDTENILLSWSTIRHNWEDDKLSDNFELHSHFVEQLLFISLGVSKRLETPPFQAFKQQPVTIGYSREHRQVELLAFSCSLLPNMIENMAKIRGLSSFAAAVGTAPYAHDRKLRYMLQCAREQNDKIRHCAQRLSEVLREELKAKQVIDGLETKFVHLIELVTHDVLSGKTIVTSSSQLFDLASTIIDQYWGIVDDGLNVVRAWHRDDLEAWICSH